MDLEALVSLISSIEWQCWMRTTTVTVLTSCTTSLSSRFTCTVLMQCRRQLDPSPKRIAKAKAVINPHNNDDYCFIYTVQLGLVDFSCEHNCWRITNLQKLVAEQGVFINCQWSQQTRISSNLRRITLSST